MAPNLAALARTALAPEAAPGGPGADGPPGASVADVHVRGDLGFVLLLHRRKDGAAAEELYASARGAGGVWDEPEHLSGGVLGLDPRAPGAVAEVLAGRTLALFGESETGLWTGRPGSDEGYEQVRFHELLVDPRAGHLEIRGADPCGDPSTGVRKALRSPLALVAVLPGERLTVRAVAPDGPLGEPLALPGPGDS
jgi:hypothetical protein